METLRIQRTSEYNNRLRDYKIFVDGQQIGNVANGKTMDFKTTPGPHIVYAKIDWCSSPEILLDIKENETHILKVGGFKNGNWLMPVAGGIIGLHFILKILANMEYTVILIIPVVILLGYYLTIARKKYLTLTRL